MLPGRRNIHCERVVPKDVESQSTELCQTKRLARYLERERQRGQVFECGKLAEELTVFTDSLARRLESRRAQPC